MTASKVKFNRQRRQKRVRAKIKAYSKRKFRVSVFRSNKHFYAQLIDNTNGRTIITSSDLKFSKTGDNNKNVKLKPSEVVKKVGNEFAKKLLEKGIKEVVFDRSYYKFHGLVKSFVMAVREAGIKI